MVTNDICLFTYGKIKLWERIWLQMIFVYFYMEQLNRGRENLVTNDICLFLYGAIVVIISQCYKFSRQYTTAASFIFGLARPI